MFGRKARRIRELETRLQELTDPKILEAHLKDGTIDLRLESPVARFIAAFFWSLLEGHTTGTYAPNFVQVRVVDPRGKAMEITARRAEGRMPSEVLAEVHAELEALKKAACPLADVCQHNALLNPNKTGAS